MVIGRDIWPKVGSTNFDVFYCIGGAWERCHYKIFDQSEHENLLRYFMFDYFATAIICSSKLITIYIGHIFHTFYLSYFIVYRNMQRERNVLFSQKQQMMLEGWYRPCTGASCVRCLMWTSHRMRRQKFLQASMTVRSIYWLQLMFLGLMWLTLIWLVYARVGIYIS